MVKVEICINCDSEQSVLESVGASYLAGASTIELCANMKEDGFTPSKTQIIDARNAFKDRNGLMVMIRNRSGDFCYTQNEIIKMGEQIIMASDYGADGVVFGVLDKNNKIDLNALEYLTRISKNNKLKVTFHRAFDASSDTFESFETLANYEVDRILTSGTKWNDKKSAIDGINNLNHLIEKSNNKPEIVIGGGINITNITTILDQIEFTNKIISVHSYSGVQQNGFTKFELVKSLVDQVNKFN